MAPGSALGLAWHPPQEVPRSGAARAHLEVDASATGKSAMAWVERKAPSWPVKVAERPGRSAPWMRPVEVGAAPDVEDLVVDVSADGTTHVAWITQGSGQWMVNFVSRRAGDRSFSDPTSVALDASTPPTVGGFRIPWAHGGEIQGPVRLAFDATGRALAVWEERQRVVRFAERQAGGGPWGPAQSVPTGANAGYTVLHVAGGGNGYWAIAVYRAGNSEDLVLYRRTPGGNFDDGITLFEGDNPPGAAVFLDAKGKTTVVSSLRDFLGTSEFPAGARRPSSSRELTSPRGDELGGWQAAHADGQIAVVWDQAASALPSLYGMIRNEGGKWSPRRAFGSDAAEIVLTLDGRGSLTVGSSASSSNFRGAPVLASRLAPSTARCRGQAATIVGTAKADRLVGSNSRTPDVIVARGGADRVLARNGNDFVCGGGGADTIDGGGNNDLIDGGTGKDRLIGERGRDRLFGGLGSDRLFGNRSNDFLDGGPGRDRANGGPGRDRCIRALAIAC